MISYIFQTVNALHKVEIHVVKFPSDVIQNIKFTLRVNFMNLKPYRQGGMFLHILKGEKNKYYG